VVYIDGKVAQTTAYIFGTQSSSGQETKILKTSAYMWKLRLKELGQTSR